MADKPNDENKNIRWIIGRRINMDQPVNQTVTLPSAEKPAEPPKGKGQGTGKIVSAPDSEKS